MKEIRILAAGYGKFASYTDASNPANKVAKTFAGAQLSASPKEQHPAVHGYHVLVPVVWDRAWATIQKAVQEIEPHALICMGVSDGTTRFERIARNEARIDLQDAEGKYFQQPFLLSSCKKVSIAQTMSSSNQWPHQQNAPFRPLAQYEDGTPAPYLLPSTLPCEYLEEQMNTSCSNILRIDGPTSFDAGGYLCNLAFYLSSLFLHGQVAFSGFLHIAPDKEDKVYMETGPFIFTTYGRWLQRNFLPGGEGIAL